MSKLTSMPAGMWGFHDRGLLHEGLMADLCIFDPDTVAPSMPSVAKDLPGGATRLVQKAQGIKATVVNGEVLTEDGEHTGAYPGQVLRSRSPAADPFDRRGTGRRHCRRPVPRPDSDGRDVLQPYAVHHRIARRTGLQLHRARLSFELVEQADRAGVVAHVGQHLLREQLDAAHAVLVGDGALDVQENHNPGAPPT